MGETSQGKIRTNSEASSKVETLSIIDAAQKFFRHPAARLPAACNQMNAPCKQLRNKKVLQCAWSLRLDVGQGLLMQETFPCSCYGALLTRGQVLLSAGAGPFIFFTEVWHVESSLQISVEAFLTDVWKRFYFCEIFLFIVFFIFIWARDIWPMIDSVDAVQGFPSQLRSSVVCGSRISFSDILLTWLAFFVARTYI